MRNVLVEASLERESMGDHDLWVTREEFQVTRSISVKRRYRVGINSSG